MNSDVNLSGLFKRACQLQVLYWVLVAVWNIAGLVLINMGQRPLGPTASILPVLVLGLITAYMLFAGSKQSKVYPYLATVVLLLAAVIVVQAFIKPAILWPSDFWRYAGVAVNGLGCVASATGLIWYVKRIKQLSPQ